MQDLREGQNRLWSCCPVVLPGARRTRTKPCGECDLAYRSGGKSQVCQFAAPQAQGEVVVDGMIALVIEDDPVLRQFLRRLLERHGAEVLLADSEAQGLDLLKSGRQLPHVVTHGDALVREAPARLAARVEQIVPGMPVVTYGGATVLPRISGRRRQLSAGAPFDAEALVQEMQFAVRRADNAAHENDLDNDLDESRSATG